MDTTPGWDSLPHDYISKATSLGTAEVHPTPLLLYGCAFHKAEQKRPILGDRPEMFDTPNKLTCFTDQTQRAEAQCAGIPLNQRNRSGANPSIGRPGMLSDTNPPAEESAGSKRLSFRNLDRKLEKKGNRLAARRQGSMGNAPRLIHQCNQVTASSHSQVWMFISMYLAQRNVPVVHSSF